MESRSLSDPASVHAAAGFLTSRFGNEDTGFERQPGEAARDARDIGLSLNANSGASWVEEGQMAEGGGRITFRLRWLFALPSLKAADLPANVPSLYFFRSHSTLDRMAGHAGVDAKR